MFKKRYYVAIWTKRGFYGFSTNSLRITKKLAKNPILHMFAHTIKVTDHVKRDVIYYRDREES